MWPDSMIKRLLNRALSVLPELAQFRIRDRYWRVKSKLLYQSLYRALHLECTLQSGLTLKVASKGEWWIYNDIFVNGEYDLPIQNALEDSLPEKPFVVLDLGANVGYFGLRVLDLMRRKYREHVPEITMVEGNPATFKELQVRIHSQNLPSPRVSGCSMASLDNGRAALSCVNVRYT